MAFKVWDWKKNPEIKGKLIAKLNNIPPWSKRVYGIELDNGEIWHVWGTKVLVGLLAPLPFMTKVRIRNLGKGLEKPTDQYEAILYDIKYELPDRSRKADKLKKNLEKLNEKEIEVKD